MFRGRSGPSGLSEPLESIDIVIKAKRPEMMSPGVPEILLCLAAIQQSRKALEPYRIVPTVYGILTEFDLAILPLG
jgi:hypothetical protein